MNTKNNLAETKMEKKKKTGSDYNATKNKTFRYSLIKTSVNLHEEDHKLSGKIGKTVLNGKTGRISRCDV